MSKSGSLAQLGEFGWLKKLLPTLFWPPTTRSQLVIGPGDDAGVVKITPGRVLVMTTDALVEGIHFERRWFSWEDLGQKSLAVNLSDLAAMGDVKPIGALVTAAFPGDTPIGFVDQFYRGLEKCARRWKTGFLGGDTVGSLKGWTVSITVFGEADPKRLVKRSGAKPGDFIFTSGPLGLSGAGLEVLQLGKEKWSWTAPLVQAFSRPEPRFAIGNLLGRRQWASSLMDCSDGLEASVRLLAEASATGADIFLDQLPMPSALRRWARYQKKIAWQYALSGGEDYELIFTVSPKNVAAVRRAIPAARAIGRLLPAGQGIWAVDGKKRRELRQYGFAHFA